MHGANMKKKNQYCINEEIKSKISSGNACYNSSQSLSSGLLPNM